VQLIECYLTLFDRAISEKEQGSRLLTALLLGINRAFPFLNDLKTVEKHMDALFQIVHTAKSFTTSTQALTLISHLTVPKNNIAVNNDVSNNNNSKNDDLTTEDDSQSDYHKIDNINDKKAVKKNRDSELFKTEVKEEEESSLIKRYYRALYAKLLSDQVFY
jgi:hypothetical protein